jgi:hypothetical protein
MMLRIMDSAPLPPVPKLRGEALEAKPPGFANATAQIAGIPIQ